MINCPNPSCKTANPEEAHVCQACQSVLPHYYLWGVGDLVTNLKPGTLVNQRYLLKRDRIFLDTKPGILPESLPEIPAFLLPYLHLSAYPLHVPRPYSVLKTPENQHVLMLESSALSMAETKAAEGPAQLPRLINCWSDAPPLRQLNWLWQIAQMWDGLVEEQVAATLLDSSLLRVDGSIVRLLELASPMPPSASMSKDVNLASDSSESPTLEIPPLNRTEPSPEALRQPTLIDLARSWQPLAESAHQAVRSFLQRLCENLERQQLNSEQLSEQLSQAIAVCASAQQVTYSLSVQTDQGPTRKRNEDACFPESGTHLQQSSEQTKSTPQLLIVCDGIGGHQGGDVASKLAIKTIRQQLEPILAANSPDLSSTELVLAIEAAICAANDEISAQNDEAQRQARDRMGTTLVLALVQGANVYIAHLGDSRAYRISSHNCQQVTLDDDVASRQVRLGGALYREVLVQPGSGSLIQALGMGPSQALRPTVQQFVIDESCVFLLCSDGLSDSDRVEQFWQQELSPLLTGKAPFSGAGARLVDLANKCNGHDNVTVGLLNAQVVSASDRIVPREMASTANLTTASSGLDDTDQTLSTQPKKKRKGRPITTLGSGVKPSSTKKSSIKPSPEQSNAPSFAKVTPADTPATTTAAFERPQQTKGLVGNSSGHSSSGSGLKKVGLALLGTVLVGGLLFAIFPGLRWRLFSPDNGASTERQTDDTDGSAPASLDTENSGTYVLPALNVQDYIRISQAVNPAAGNSDAGSSAAGDSQSVATDFGIPLVYPSPEIGLNSSPNDILGTIPTGAIVQVVAKQTAEDESSWVQVQLCSIPSGESLSDVPTESDTASSQVETDTDTAGLNVPESTETDQPLMLNPGSEGWMEEVRLAAIARPIENPIETLQPSQQGSCER